MNDMGRSGLGVVFCGFYLLTMSVKQAFNVGQKDDMRRMLMD